MGTRDAGRGKGGRRGGSKTVLAVMVPRGCWSSNDYINYHVLINPAWPHLTAEKFWVISEFEQLWEKFLVLTCKY